MSSTPPPAGPGLAAHRWAAWVRQWSSQPAALPRDAGKDEQFFYGVAQPLLGLRVVAGEPRLRRAALLPVVAVAVLCVLVDATELASFGSFLLGFMVTFAALAAVPPVLFARHYARMAANARNVLGLGPRAPYLKGLRESCGEWLRMLVIVGIGIAPITFTLAMLPMPAPILATVLSLAWTLLWIVVEALDGARTLGPDPALHEHERMRVQAGPVPVFVAWPVPPSGPVYWLFLPLWMLNEVVAHLARPWSAELRQVERVPWMAVGFGVGTAILLAIPGVNLLFRPAVIVGGAHLLARLESREPMP